MPFPKDINVKWSAINLIPVLIQYFLLLDWLHYQGKAA